MKSSNQRLVLSDAHDHQIRQIALRESRSIANTLTRLIDEALVARRKADGDITALVAVLRSKAAP